MAVTNGFRAVGNSADFLPHTHSPDNIRQFISYLKLLLLPEVKYGERLLPVGKKKPGLCLAVLSSLMITHVVVLPLPVILADDVSQKVWLSLIST